MKDKKSVKSAWPPPLPFSKKSLTYYIAGLITAVTGYLLMSVGPWDNPISRTIAPLVLLVAYVVIFPMAIIFWEKRSKSEE